MKIAIVVSDPSSGLLFYPVYMAAALKSQGHAVTAISWTSQLMQTKGLDEQLSISGVRLHVWPALRRAASLSSALGVFSKINKVQNDCFDLVVSFGPYVTWQMRKYLKNASHYLTMVEAMGHDGKSYLKPHIGAILLNVYSDTVIALCKFEQERLESLGVRPGKMKIVFNPVNTAHIVARAEQILKTGKPAILSTFHLDPGRRLIVCLASFQARKRQDILIRAFSTLVYSYPEYDVVLAGDGAERPSCERLSHQLGIRDRVHFVGQLDNDQALKLLACADVVAHCSNADTFGYSMVEPLLLEKPTIVTRVGIGWELEQADVAEVVVPDDTDAFTAGLRRVLEMGPQIRARLLKGKSFVIENFDVHEICKQILNLATTAKKNN